MGIFDLFKKDSIDDEVTTSSFKKIVIESSDISKDLNRLAKEYNLSQKDLDFRIISYKTFYKDESSTKYRELQTDSKESFFQEENILNPKLEVTQKIKIEVFKKSTSSNFIPQISLSANKTLTKIVATIKKCNNIEYHNELESDILNQIDKKKAKQKILLGCFDKEVKVEIKRVASSIRVNGKIDEDISIVICKAYEVKEHIAGKINYIYRDKEKDTGQKIDHSKKGFMHTVKSGDTVVEVIKAQNGVVGRNCKGEILIPKSIELSKELPKIKVSEDIEIKEDSEKILYIAKRQGFINEINSNEFEIRDELVINEVSFKTTGSIETGGDKDIKINIECNDSMSDAIGAGVSIETSEIKAGGNVGNGAVVKANIIEIGGQTHKSSKLYGGDININLHKGYANGEKVTIELLDGGRVVGDIVHIKKASGGEVFAKEVYIEKVLSNLNVHASHHIELERVEGTGNKFFIDAKAQRGFEEKLDSINKSIKESEIEMDQIVKKIKKIKIKINHEKETTINIYEKIKELKASGVKPPPSLIKKMKENQNRIKEHNLLIKELKDGRIKKEALMEELKTLQASVFEAKVINNSSWKEFNEVTFVIVDPPVTASHFLKDGEIAKEITLGDEIDGKFELNRKG